MSFAVALAAAPPSLARRIRASLVVFGVLSGTLAVVAAAPDRRAWVAAIASCLLALSLRRGAALLADGRLAIDERGAATWVPASGTSRGVRIERWSVHGPLAWLRLRFADTGCAHDLLLWRRDADAEHWRRLRVWLAWLARGREHVQEQGRAHATQR